MGNQDSIISLADLHGEHATALEDLRPDLERRKKVAQLGLLDHPKVRAG